MESFRGGGKGGASASTSLRHGVVFGRVPPKLLAMSMTPAGVASASLQTEYGDLIM